MLKTIRVQLNKWKLFKKKLKEESFLKYVIVESVETIIVALALALIIRKYIIMTSVVPTGSMIPSLKVKDRLFVNKFIYRFVTPERGDIVVFKSPYKDRKDYVKRCIGLPGDRVKYKKARVYINGDLLVLPGVTIMPERMELTEEARTSLTNAEYQIYLNTEYKQSLMEFDEVVVPENSYYMLGDNRANSADSRFWGFVPKKDLLGKAIFTFWPLNRMRILR